MTMDENHRYQIEEALGRPLSNEELDVVDDLASLPVSHLDVMEALYLKDAVAALQYMRAVTRDIDRSILRNFVHGFDGVAARRNKAAGLRAQRLYENELGRVLTHDETLASSTLRGLTEAQRAVARALDSKDTGIALAYVSDLVPVATLQERQTFLEGLRR